MKEIRAFIDQFTPKIEPPEGAPPLKPRVLLFDPGKHYADVRFSSQELRACIAGYLALIPQIIAAFEEAQVAPKKRVLTLVRTGHDDASDLLLAYLYRAQKDDDFPTLIHYLQEADAVGQMTQLIDFVDPEGRYEAIEVGKRVYNIRAILVDLMQQGADS